MCWCQSLILRYASKDSCLIKWQLIVFSTYHGNHFYLSCYLYTWLNITDLLAIIDISVLWLWVKLELKLDSWFYAHPGHCSRCLPWHLPQVFACYASLIDHTPYLLQMLHHGTICLLLSTGRLDEERCGFPVGEPQYLPPTALAQTPLPLSGRLVLPEQSQGLGGETKASSWHGFLASSSRGFNGWQTMGLSTVWTDPSQVRADSMEEAVGKLTTCTPIGTNCPYSLVWLHKGTHHAPLPKEGHLGILPQRGEEVVPCGWISQLEVCQLLGTSPQVVYPVGLNGQDEPVITSLPEPLASSISLTTGKPVYLQIDILSTPVEEPD